MASAVQRATVVQPDGTVAVRVPELAPGQRVRVTVELEPTPSETRSALAVLDELPGHRLFQTADEVDAYLRAERDAWDR
jgi:hypothetical protein